MTNMEKRRKRDPTLPEVEEAAEVAAEEEEGTEDTATTPPIEKKSLTEGTLARNSASRSKRESLRAQMMTNCPTTQTQPTASQPVEVLKVRDPEVARNLLQSTRTTSQPCDEIADLFKKLICG